MKYFLALAVMLVANSSLAAEISWEVHNNFSIFKSMGRGGKNGQDDFYRQLATAQKCEKHYHEAEEEFASVCRGPMRRLPSLQNVDEHYVYDPTFVFSSSAGDGDARRVRFRRINFTVSFSRKPKGSECFWDIDGEIRRGKLEGRKCTHSRALEVGKHAVRAWIGDAREPVESATLSFKVKDIVIVVLGNSYASGEGNPNQIVRYGGKTAERSFTAVMEIQKPAIWWEPRCHRSLFSSAHLGAALLARDNPHLSVTLLSFACSGASVLEGIVGPFIGIESKEQIALAVSKQGHAMSGNSFKGALIPPQIDSARRSLCLRKSKDGCAELLPVDVVIGAIGMNDLEWVDLVQHAIENNCTKLGSRKCDEFERELKNARKEAPRLFDRNEPCGEKKDCEVFIKFDEEVSTLKPRKKILLGYQDPLRDEHGQYCDDQHPDRYSLADDVTINLFGLGLSPAENALADKYILQFMDGALKKFAAARNWDMITHSDKRRGYCARVPWYNNYSESLRRQGFRLEDSGTGLSTGTLHPNLLGHSANAALIHKALIQYVNEER